MNANVKIEIDEQTADVLQVWAAELGVPVSQLVAELATLDSDAIVAEPEVITELDGGVGTRSRRAHRRSHTSVSSAGCARGERRGFRPWARSTHRVLAWRG